MAIDLDIHRIAWDSIRPFRFGKGRRISIARLILAVGFPASLAIWMSFRHPVIADKYQITLLTVFGMVAAVMTALLPVVQYVVGVGLPDKRYTESQYAIWEHQVARLEVLRDLYSSISMAVILLVFSLVPITLLQIPNLPAVVNQTISGSIYFVGFSVAISFVQIVCGVYLVLEAQAKEIAQKLDDLAPKN